MVVWLALAGAFAIYLFVSWQLPSCENARADLINFHCHTAIGIGLCLSALTALYLLYIRYIVLVSQIAYIPRSNYGVDES